jgi:hypothetical protein
MRKIQTATIMDGFSGVLRRLLPIMCVVVYPIDPDYNLELRTLRSCKLGCVHMISLLGNFQVQRSTDASGPLQLHKIRNEFSEQLLGCRTRNINVEPQIP